MNSNQNLRRTAAVTMVLGGLWFAPAILSADNDGLLTNASDILTLPAERAARHLKVDVTGTAITAPTLGGSSFFVQDATGGVFVAAPGGPRPDTGDVVRISGVTESGDYAPVIAQPIFVKVGSASLPVARPTSVDRFMSGVDDSQRIEVSGIVRAAQLIESNSVLDLEIASAGYRFHALSKFYPGMDPKRLIAAKVRLKGTSAASFNRVQRRLTAVKLYMTSPADLVVEEYEPVNPFDEPVLELENLGQYRKDKKPGQRVHVRGQITFQRPGQDFFLQDQGGGLHVESRQPGTVALGDVVDAVGFPDFENYLPVLQDAEFRTNSKPGDVPATKPVTIQAVEQGLCQALLVSIKGKLLDRFVTHDRDLASGIVRARSVLLLQSGNFTFTAVTEAPMAMTHLGLLPIGSTIEVGGVCFTESDLDGKSKSFQILMPTGKDVQVIERPSWLTPRRLIIGAGTLLFISIVASGWTVMVSKKNATLKALITDKEKARVELRQAHDQLEERVKERTAQLKFEITARKELELQSKATLTERTRLAQELHDTLEQSLTGVALQLDTTAKLFEKKTDSAKHHLELARTLITESQVEVHRSVWNLRCRALEQFDLPGALLMSCQQITEGSGLRVELKARGEVRPLPETLEENLLRIGQEAVTNVIKHSGAALAEIELQYGPKAVILQVKDNGRGFTPNNSAGPDEGHFGILGISERVKRLHGEIALSSALNEGTTLRVQLPIPQEACAPLHASSQIPV